MPSVMPEASIEPVASLPSLEGLEGYAEAGWRCPSCAYLAAVGRSCPLCGAEMAEVPDVVEDETPLLLV